VNDTLVISKKMNDYLPSEATILKLIHKHAKPPTLKKVKNVGKSRLMDLLYGHYEEYSVWKKHPDLLKQMQMNVGYFIQDIIGNCAGHINYNQGHSTKIDGENTLNAKRVMYEIKVDENTTNDSSLRACINTLKKAEAEHDITPLFIQFFRTNNIIDSNKNKKILISGNDYLNEYVSPSIGGVEGLLSHIDRSAPPCKLTGLDLLSKLCCDI
jgi:hypothetical protein|tara:strand:- start:345 stop:980 length:636 start_codon:yes stop_codon:yes gene_type:complete